MSRKPDFIIIGAMKCATTSLHDQLATHSGIFGCEPKEPNFFSDEEVWSRGLAWYFGLFEGAGRDDLCGEGSTHYTKAPHHPDVVQRLAQHVPDAKFIYVMRHPVDRLVSHYVHEWTQRVIDEPLSTAVRSHAPLVDYGCYAKQLRPYFEAFGRDRVLPVFFDRLRSDPQAEIERVCAFIGYEGKALWKSDLGPSNVSGQRMRTSALRDFVVNLPVLSTIRKRLIPQQLRDRVRQFWLMKERPKLSPSDRDYLTEIFDRDLATLGAWLGIELTCDTFVAQTKVGALEWADPGAESSA